MEYKELHRWDVSASEAIKIQNSLRSEVRMEKLTKEVKYIA